MGFFEEYFLNHYLQNGGFNILDTLVYGAILILGVIGVYKLLKFLDIQIDRKFFVALLPFIFFASLTRAFRDYIYTGITSGVLVSTPTNFYTDLSVNFQTVYSTSLVHIKSILPVPGIPEFYSSVVTWFVTPGSYLITAGIAFVIFLISVGLQKKLKIVYWKPMFVLGLIVLSMTIVTPIAQIFPLFQVLAIAVPLTGLFLLISWALKKSKWQKPKEIVNYFSTAILSVHLLDAAATSVAINFYGFGEQHVVGGSLFSNLGGFYGAIGFFISKIVVVYLAVWLFKKDVQDPRLRNFLLVIILILGLAPALRDITSLLIPSFY